MSKEEGVQASLVTPSPPRLLTYSHSINEIAKARVIQKNVVYVIGLSSAIADNETLMKQEYFGQYGPIIKVVVNKNGYANNKSEMTYSAYVSFSSPKDASLALLAIDNTEINGHVLRSSFGTTKYCSFFLKGMDCINKDCLYLHSLAEDEDTLFKEDSHSNKRIFLQQQRIAMRIANIHYKDYKPKHCPRVVKAGFPSVNTLYNKEYLFDSNNYYSYCNGYQTRKMRKSSEYDGSYQFNQKWDDEEDGGDVEYVLVKEPSSKRRKWKAHAPSKQGSKNEGKKRKRNFTLEDIKIPKETQNETFSSASSASTSHSNKNITKDKSMKQSLYQTAQKSRFEFAIEANSQSQSIEIPNFIQDLILKNTSSLSFFKRFNTSLVDFSDVLRDESYQITSWND